MSERCEAAEVEWRIRESRWAVVNAIETAKLAARIYGNE